MKCIGIIWNSAFQYKEEITKIISRYALSIERQFEMNLGNQFEEFIWGIYMSESMEMWKIESKISHMQLSSGRSIQIIIFEIDANAKRYHEKKKKYVYSNLQELKDLLRSSYRDRVQNYFFDIIFHCTETEEEYQKCYEIIKKYIRKIN